MKKLIIFLIAFNSVLSSLGQQGKIVMNGREDQPKTIFGDTRVLGGYVGFGLQAYDFDGEIGYGFSTEIAAVIGRKFNLGFSGQVLATDVLSGHQDLQGNSYFYEMAYGGLFIEPMLGSKWPIHITFPTTLGAGATSESIYRVFDWEWGNYGTDVSRDYFFVAQPGVNVEINLLRIMRLAAGVNYRFTSDVTLHGRNDNLSGFGGNITLKLGWF